MMDTPPESDLPNNLGRPAQRALVQSGYSHLEQLTSVTEAEILSLHGIGPKAAGRLRQALEAKGLALASSDKK